MNLRADENPKSKHADIIGWPEEKDRLQAIAIDLAADVDVKKI